MASSNRHWPNMFKSKPCNTPYQCLHDINSMNPSCLLSSQKPPCSSAPAVEERNPEPKPRWNPKPEQIKILEAIFNSGTVNPPRDEIRRIRDELKEFGQVGDASVFYWFQNRKSRSKHKLRKAAAAAARSHPRSAVPPTSTVPVTTTKSSSSSSSELSTGSDKIPPPPVSLMNMCGSPTASLNQTYFPGPVDISRQPLIFQGHQGYYISSGELTGNSGAGELGTGVSLGILEELMLHHGPATTAAVTTSLPLPPPPPADSNVDGSPDEIQGLESVFTGTPVRSTVLIGGVAYEVVSIPINVGEVFGNDVVLVHSNGQPVLVDESGTTLHPLQHGASYYLV